MHVRRMKRGDALPSSMATKFEFDGGGHAPARVKNLTGSELVYAGRGLCFGSMRDGAAAGALGAAAGVAADGNCDCCCDMPYAAGLVAF